MSDVQAVYERFGRCVVAVSEGIHGADGTLISKGGAADVFGNVQLSGGSLGDMLCEPVQAALGKAVRVRADTFGYLQRSYVGVVSKQDALEAREVGRFAVQVATAGDAQHGSIVIQREGTGADYAPRYEVTALENVARLTQEMPERFLRGDTDVDPSFVEYCAPLVGPLPQPGRFTGASITTGR